MQRQPWTQWLMYLQTGGPSLRPLNRFSAVCAMPENLRVWSLINLPCLRQPCGACPWPILRPALPESRVPSRCPTSISCMHAAYRVYMSHTGISVLSFVFSRDIRRTHVTKWLRSMLAEDSEVRHCTGNSASRHSRRHDMSKVLYALPAPSSSQKSFQQPNSELLGQLSCILCCFL